MTGALTVEPVVGDWTPASSWRYRSAILFGWLAVLGATAGIIVRGGRHDWRSGDTVDLVLGLPGISNCLGHGIVYSCVTGHGRRVSAFALLQMIPAYALHLFDYVEQDVTGALAWLNAIVVVGFIAVVLRWCHRRAGTGLAVVGALLVIPGMLIPYSAQSFGEPLATAAFGGVVMSALRRDRPSRWLLPMALIAAISKDTAAPFVIMFGLAGIALSKAARPVAVGAAVRLAIGTVVGAVATVAFNEFRYGTVTNKAYLNYLPATPRMAVNNFAGQLVSPNGGIAWFWPGAVVALIVLTIAAVRGRWADHDPRRLRIGAALGLAAFFGSELVLSFWWSSYGWYAWGPRLLMPVVAPTILLALALVGERSSLFVWTSPLSLVVLSAIAVVAAAPAVGVVYNWHAYTAQVSAVRASNHECLPRASNRTDPPKVQRTRYEHCVRLSAWETRSTNLGKAVPRRWDGHAAYWLTLLAFAAAVVTWSGLGHHAVRHTPMRTDRRSRALAVP